MTAYAGAALPRRPRVRSTVEVFPASDGNVYLLPGGGRPHHVIRQPGDDARALIGLLDGSRDEAGLVAALAERGTPADAARIRGALGALAALGVLEDAAAPPPAVATAEMAARYSRQLPYFDDLAPDGESGWDLQLRLAGARVVVIGTGGLGTWALCGLASAGIGELVLIDDDTVELSNLNRQVLFTRADVGRPKVEAASEALEAFNPDLRVRAHRRKVAGADDVERLVTGADFVVGTADHPPHAISHWISEGCWRAGVPHVFAGQDPPHVRVGPTYWPGVSACLDCSEEALRSAYPLFDELAAFRDARPSVAATLGPASGVVGSLIAMEVVHAVTGAHPPATLGATMVLDLRTLEVTKTPVDARPGCRRCGAPF